MVAMRYVGYAVAAVATDLRAELIKSLLNVRWEYFTKQPLGRIANAVSVDSTRAGQAYLMAAVFQANLIQTVIYSLVAALVPWKLALAAVVLGGGIALSLHFLVRVSKKAGRRQPQSNSETVIHLTAALNKLTSRTAMTKAGKAEKLSH